MNLSPLRPIVNDNSLAGLAGLTSMAVNMSITHRSILYRIKYTILETVYAPRDSHRRLED